jgi:hypothetical protein
VIVKHHLQIRIIMSVPQVIFVLMVKYINFRFLSYF